MAGFYGSKVERKERARRKSRGKPGTELTPGKTKRQTVTVAGRRTTITTRMNMDGTTTVTRTGAGALESDLQEAQVEWMKSHPLYRKRFLFAASMEAGKRGPQAQKEAIATGMVAGEPDLRIYVGGSAYEHPVTFFIENKAKAGRLSTEQKTRHEELAGLGFDVRTIKAETPEEAVAELEKVLKVYLL